MQAAPITKYPKMNHDFAVKQAKVHNTAKWLLLRVGEKWIWATLKDLNVQGIISNINRFFSPQNEKPIFKYNPIYIEAHLIFYFCSYDEAII